MALSASKEAKDLKEHSDDGCHHKKRSDQQRMHPPKASPCTSLFFISHPSRKHLASQTFPLFCF